MVRPEPLAGHWRGAGTHGTAPVVAAGVLREGVGAGVLQEGCCWKVASVKGAPGRLRLLGRLL